SYAGGMSTDAHQAAPDTLDPARRDAILADHAALRASFAAGTTAEVSARLAQLAALRRGIRAEEPRLVAALAKDLGKSRTESALTEIGVVLQEITHTIRHLRSWLAPQRLSLGPLLAPAKGQLVREPLGTVLIIAPWNYPVNL